MFEATQISAQVRDGRRSPREVVEQCLARIAEADPAIGAFQAVAAGAARRAADALAERSDLDTLPLAGVPVAIKDNLDVAGLPTRHGSAATASTPAAEDDELVRRLRAAGAIVVGKTRMPELAIWPFTESAAFGGTRNPGDPARNAGGSTGGAAAVAAGMVPVALGSDGGGSLRIPAANCGVVGFKPGRGTLATAEHWYGCTAYGPITSNVADAALTLDVLAGTQRWRTVAPDAGRLRVAVSLRSPSPFARPDGVAKAALGQAADLARAAGHATTSANPPYPATLINAWARYWYAGVALEAQQRRLDPARLEPRTRTVIKKGARKPDPAVASSWRKRVLGWFEQYDVLLTPTIARPAPPAGRMTNAGFLSSYVTSARAVPYTQAWNFAGLPALSLPMGAGAVQIIAPDEEMVLRVALQLERLGAISWRPLSAGPRSRG